jgi:uncharacterized protein
MRAGFKIKSGFFDMPDRSVYHKTMDLENRILVNISDDETVCDVTILPTAHPDDPPVEIMEFIDFLNSRKVIYGMDEAAITENVLLANEKQERVTFTAARAIPPINGKTGRLTLKVHFPFEEHKRMLTSQKTILSGAKVMDGQLLMIVNNKDLDGIDGTSVLGKPIPADLGKPIRIISGKNVKCSVTDEDTYYYATTEGIAWFENDELLYVKTYSDGWYEIRISEDKLKLFISLYPPTGGGRFVQSPEIVEHLLNEKIVLPPEKLTEIRRLIMEVSANNKEITDHVLLEGQPPVDGGDSRIELAVNIMPLRVVQDSEKQMDFHDIMRINQVQKGQLLAHKIPNTKASRNGVNIFGETIHARDGRDSLFFKTGENVKVSEDGLRYFADADGQVKFRHNVLWVSKVFIVEGDLDFAVGNITFNGDVIIKGSIPDNFQIKADGNIVVGNSIGSSHVYAGNNLFVRNGIINRKKSRIIVQGDMRCRFIENSLVEIHGSAFIEEYILHSQIYCHNSVFLSLLHKGQIVGGETFAENSIDAKQLGNQNDIPTHLFVGKTVFTAREIKQIEKDLIDIHMKIKKIDELLNNTLQAENPDLYKEHLRNRISFSYSSEQLLNRKLALMEELEQRHACSIHVKKEIYPKTELTLNNRRLIIRQMDSFKTYSFRPAIDNIIVENYKKTSENFGKNL